MKVFISYHRADTKYRRKAENILENVGIDYYAVPEDADFNGQYAETINRSICEELKQCDILLCIIGKDTYKRPHVDREIHTALKGSPGTRKGIIGVLLESCIDDINKLDEAKIPEKLKINEDYVVWTLYKRLNNDILKLVDKAIKNSKDKKLKTNHTNPCRQLKSTLYYDG